MKNVKRDLLFIIVSVCILTIATLSASYAYFFSITSKSTIQEISTGTLSVVIDTSSIAINNELFLTATDDLPTSKDAVVTEGQYATIDLSNNGTLDADFLLTVSYADELPSGYTKEDLLPFEYLMIGIFDVSKNEWVNFSNDESIGMYNTSINSFTPSGENIYPILRDIIEATKMKQYKIYIWLSENTPTTEIGNLVYLKLDVKSTTVDGHVTNGSE